MIGTLRRHSKKFVGWKKHYEATGIRRPDLQCANRDRFPDQWIIPYNLARYAAQLGDLVAARDLLAQAFRVGDAKALKLQSLDEPDLASLWVTMR